MLTMYREAIALRHWRLPHDDSAFEWLDSPEDVLSFRRGDVTVVANFGRTPVAPPAGELLFASSSTALTGGLLARDAAAWIGS